MPWVLPWVKSIASAFQSGVSRLTTWLFSDGRSQSSITQELGERMPNLPVTQRTTLYNRMSRSVEIGRQITENVSRPDYRRVPRDPSFQGKGQYRYDIEYIGHVAAGPGQTEIEATDVSRLFFHYSERPLSWEELQQAAQLNLREQLNAETIVGGAGPDAVVTQIDITISAVWRSR